MSYRERRIATSKEFIEFTWFVGFLELNNED